MLFFLSYIILTTLNKVCDGIRYDIDSQQITVLALLDISNVFDTVYFDILLAILRSINISPKAVEWFSPYFHSRTQSIKLELAFRKEMCCVPFYSQFFLILWFHIYPYLTMSLMFLNVLHLKLSSSVVRSFAL